MYTIDIMRQLLLYGHILVFALAMAEVLREDWQMLRADRLDLKGLDDTARRIKWLLILLWATGIPLVGMSIGWDVTALAAKPKLMTKIIVTCALTVNGVLLHYIAFPLLQSRGRPGVSAAVASILGSVSTVSWLYAAFVGAARLIAPQMTMDIFLGLYAVMLAGGISVALLFMRQRVERMMAMPPIDPVIAAEEDEIAAFKAIESAMTAVSQAQNRLVAARESVLARSGENPKQILVLPDPATLPSGSSQRPPALSSDGRLPKAAMAG